MSDTVDQACSYRAVALQTSTHAVNRLGVAAAREAILENIRAVAAQVEAAVRWHGPDTRLVVLPEYTFTAFPMGDTIEGWAAKAAFAVDGPEYDALAEIAVDNGVFLVSNNYETDAHFPGLYFQGNVIHSPGGEVVLRYRRLHSMYSPSPYDVWDDYLDAYGIDGVLPVARTEIGSLAAIASEEILYPELLRSLAMRGAEVFVHPTSESSSPDLSPKEIARRARAVENIAYVVSANSGGIRNIALSGDSTNGHSEIVDHRGISLARADSGESLVAAAEIDLTALRRERRRPAMINLPARVKSRLWAEEYSRHDVDRPNGLAETKAERSYFVSRHVENIARLHEQVVGP